jgi:putative ABC transport system permease protein
MTLQRVFGGIGRELGQSLRSLARDRGFSAVAVVTLALAIGATTGIFSVVYAVVIRDLPFAAEEQLVVAWKVTDSPWAEVAYAEFKDWQAQSRSFSSLAALPTLAYGQGYVLTGHGDAALIESTKVTGRFFSLLGVPAALGRVLDENDDRVAAPKAVVISHRLWRERFGADPGIVGRPITLTGNAYTVVGVTPVAFEFPKGVDLWMAFVAESNPRTLENRGFAYLQTVGRLRPGVTLREAEAELNTIIARIAHEHPETGAEGHRAVITPLADHLLGSARLALWLLLAATGMLLLIGCANVANLLLARATSRRRELALRAALGADRWQLARPLACESLVLAFAGGALGLLLARGLMAWLVHVAPADIPRMEEVRLQGQVLAFSAFVTLLTALFFGLLPAFSAARVELTEALGEGGSRLSADRWGKRVRSGLIVAEVAVAVVLLLGGALVLRSFAALSAVDLGFEPRNVLTMQLNPRGAAYGEPEARRAFFRRLIEGLESQPGVEAASAVLIRPLEGTVGWDTTYSAEGQSADEVKRNAVANYEVVSPHYFRVFGIALRAGREFTRFDKLAGDPVVILSETLAKHLFGSARGAVGKRLIVDTPGASWRTVVGVAADVRYRELEDVRLDVYIPLEQSESAWINHFAVRTASEPTAFLPLIRREVAALDPTQAVSSVATMDQIVDGQRARPRFNAVLLNWLSGLALLLAIVGIHGVVAYSVAQRTGELAIRMAVGAQAGEIVRLVVSEGMRPVLTGVAVGLGAAIALGRLIQKLLFGVSATDPFTFLGVASVLSVVAIVACWIPAESASRLDPLAALRRE